LKHRKPKPRRRGGEEPGGDEPGGDEPRRNQPYDGESEDDIPDDAGENQGENWTRNLINEAVIPEHLRFLLHHVDWINSEDAKEAPGRRLLNDDQIKELKNMCARHFTAHPRVPLQFGGHAKMNPPVTAPEEMLERRLRIHSHAVRETLEWCIREGSPATFRYLWANWYRCAFANRGPRWELVSLSWKDDLPISSTTMRIEAHWKHRKASCLYDFRRPRLDFLLVLLCDKYYVNIVED
jgi:hypothetical protein